MSAHAAHLDRCAVGIGLRQPHVAELLERRPALGFLEVHAENYMGGGPALAALERLRRDYPLSLHGVGLSLGGADPLDARHLDRLARLVRRLEPQLMSEHLAWSAAAGAYFNHLLPLPYDADSLAVICERIGRVQDALGRPVLLENPSRYLRFRHSPIPEPVFLSELARRTGCAILLDVNNVYVSCCNCAEDPHAYLAALPAEAIAEVHLAGHSANRIGDCTILIDDHGSAVCEAVWQLYAQATYRFGAVPTLVEWDTDLPALDILLAQAAAARRCLAQSMEGSGDAVVA
jgi:hypothetical protein